MRLTKNEGSGLLAFLFVEGGAVFVVAFAAAYLAASDGPSQSFFEGYVKYAPKAACWFGALAIPASFAWMFVRGAATNRAVASWVEIGRLLLIEAVMMVLLAVLYVEMGPAKAESAPQWSDLVLFGHLLRALSFACLVVGGVVWLVFRGGVEASRSRSRHLNASFGRRRHAETSNTLTPCRAMRASDGVIATRMRPRK